METSASRFEDWNTCLFGEEREREPLATAAWYASRTLAGISTFGFGLSRGAGRAAETTDEARLRRMTIESSNCIMAIVVMSWLVWFWGVVEMLNCRWLLGIKDLRPNS